MKRKNSLIFTILILLSLIVLTVGVSYSFFRYVKEGTTDNIISTGRITFLYTEIEKNGAGISIQDAYPMSNSLGMAQTGDKKVFNFKITSNTNGQTSIPYEITARKKSSSTLGEEAVKIYLTEVSGANETELVLKTYDNLNPTSVNVKEGTVEKTLYTDIVPANSSNYEKNYRLRMWIDSSIDFSPDAEGNYPYNGKTFTITVNVYANSEVVTIPNEPTP